MRCLACSREFDAPPALEKMAEKYVDGRPVVFCSRACNLRFVSKLGREQQEEQMRELIERLENRD